MATSIQTIGDQGEVLNDLDLLALISLLSDTASQANKLYLSLQPFIDIWNENCRNYGPGTIDLRLEEIVADNSAKSELNQLLMSVEDKLINLGDILSAESLTPFCNAPGVSFSDYSTSNVKFAIERIRTLID